jgi:hypothetical protein
MLNVGCQSQSQCEGASTHHAADSEAGNVTAGWEAPFKLPHTGSYQSQETGELSSLRKLPAPWLVPRQVPPKEKYALRWPHRDWSALGRGGADQ